MGRRPHWFLPLIALAGITMSLTAPLEVLFAREIWQGSAQLGVFMLSAAIGVIVIDVFGTRLVPSLDARSGLAAGLVLFGVACIAMAVFTGGVELMAARVVQGFGGGLVLGSGLQAAVRIRSGAISQPSPERGDDDLALSLGRFNAAFLFGGAVGAPGGLLVAGVIDGRVGYQVAFAVTGALAVAVALSLLAAVPRLHAPAAVPRPRISLPDLGSGPGGRGALLLATSGEFLRGGVLFTALPLAGAVRGYSIITITVAIALMSAVEIGVLMVAHVIIRAIGVTTLLIGSMLTGALCAAVIALMPGDLTYLTASAVFGICLAGATASLPVLVVARVGDSSAGLARFRISAGVGMLVGMVGCAMLAASIDVAVLFIVIATLLLAGAYLAARVGRDPVSA